MIQLHWKLPLLLMLLGLAVCSGCGGHQVPTTNLQVGDGVGAAQTEDVGMLPIGANRV